MRLVWMARVSSSRRSVMETVGSNVSTVPSWPSRGAAENVVVEITVRTHALLTFIQLASEARMSRLSRRKQYSAATDSEGWVGL
jgi:hypothetical protein